MRRAEGFGLIAGMVALLSQAGPARALDVAAAAAAEPAPGGTLLMFGVATLVPAVAVYAFFRRRELRGVPEAPVPKTRKPKPQKLRRLPRAEPNPVAEALAAKAVAASAPLPVEAAPVVPETTAEQPA